MEIASDAPDGAPASDALLQRVYGYLNDLISAFTGTSMDEDRYRSIRSDLLRNPAYGGLAPDFLRRTRDNGALWSFAKSVDGSWEPRRQFLRDQFEPLLQHLESGASRPHRKMPGAYDSSAWTGVEDPVQRAKAVRTLMPVAQCALEVLISQLEQPSHNGGPPLDEVEEALDHLRKLHGKLGEIILAADEGRLNSAAGEGLMEEAARYARRATKALKGDPLPYAMSAALLAVFTACGLPGLGGYLSAIAVAIRKPGQKVA